MYLSTLGYSPNSMLDIYRQAFLKKLQHLWILNVWPELPPDHFLLYPDIHWLLLVATRQWNSEWTIQYLQILQQEYDLFLQGIGVTMANASEMIPWTSIELTLDCINPDINRHTHPDHKAVSIGYNEKSPWEWRKLFTDAFAILAKVSPGFMSEIDMLLRKIIPFGVSVWWHNSGSYGDIIGHIVMSYPIGLDSPEIAVLEAILHEYNHNKINLIMQTETLILSDMREQYYSPYRPDPRHIHGIYLGVHALAGAYWVIWQAHLSGILELSSHWQEKAILYTLKNWLSLQVLDKYAHLTPLGHTLLEEMRSVHHECLDCIKKSNLPKEMLHRAKTALINHYQSAKTKHPNLQS